MTDDARGRKLLAIYAHPDDESFGSGGMLAKYAAEGASVGLVCATNGEIGEISDPDLASSDTLGDVRIAELRCAAEALGVTELVLLGYRDSGMAGTADNEDPRAFGNAAEDEVVARLVGIIRRVRPDVVVTFDPNGGYGHPDHVTVHDRTVAAFHAAGDARSHHNEGEAWQPPRLVYTVFARSTFEQLREKLTLSGVDVGELARWEEVAIMWEDEDVHVALDVSGTVDAKWKALNCHRTQFGSDNLFRRIPEEMAREIMGRENFSIAWPETPPGVRLAGLFDGL